MGQPCHALSRLPEMHMPKSTSTFSVDDHFDGKEPAMRAVYDRLLTALRKFGPVREEAKKTSIHLVRATALAGVQVRKAHIVLTVKSDRAPKSPRVFKSEQVSANRFHHEVKLSKPAEIDKELLAWLKVAYELSA
jgi:hypothetical protein